MYPRLTQPRGVFVAPDSSQVLSWSGVSAWPSGIATSPKRAITVATDVIAQPHWAIVLPHWFWLRNALSEAFAYSCWAQRASFWANMGAVGSAPSAPRKL